MVKAAWSSSAGDNVGWKRSPELGPVVADRCADEVEGAGGCETGDCCCCYLGWERAAWSEEPTSRTLGGGREWRGKSCSVIVATRSKDGRWENLGPRLIWTRENKEQRGSMGKHRFLKKNLLFCLSLISSLFSFLFFSLFQTFFWLFSFFSFSFFSSFFEFQMGRKSKNTKRKDFFDFQKRKKNKN